MTAQKKLLIVDDQPPMLLALVRQFSVAGTFEYEITTASSLQDVVDQRMEQKKFDCCVFDLGFDADHLTDSKRYPLGFWPLLASSLVHLAEIQIVYTGSPQISYERLAMQLGATDFVSKADFPPHKLKERIEKTFREREENEQQSERVLGYLQKKYFELNKKYSGMVLAIIVLNEVPGVVEAGPDVVAVGKSRLDALLRYAKQRQEPQNAYWPMIPHLHIVPPSSPR